MDPFVSLLKQFGSIDLTPGYLRDFHLEVLKAVADGKLTEKEIAVLERKKELLGLSDEALSMVKQDLYTAAFLTVSEDQLVSGDEWQELEHIQDYLGLTDKDISRRKKHLYKLRILTELRKGSFPVIHTGDVLLDKNEVTHWREDVVLRKEGDAVLILSNKHVIIKSSMKTHTYTYRQILSADCSAEGIVLHVKNKPTLTVMYKNADNRDVVASLLLALLHIAKPTE